MILHLLFHTYQEKINRTLFQSKISQIPFIGNNSYPHFNQNPHSTISKRVIPSRYDSVAFSYPPDWNAIFQLSLSLTYLKHEESFSMVSSYEAKFAVFVSFFVLLRAKEFYFD